MLSKTMAMAARAATVSASRSDPAAQATGSDWESRRGSDWGSGRGQTGGQEGGHTGSRQGSDWGSGQGSEWDIHNVRLAGTHVGPLRTANTW